MRLNDDGRTVAAMDVLAPGIGEIIGGSHREERLDVLDTRIAECHTHAEHYLVPRLASLRHGRHSPISVGTGATIVPTTPEDDARNRAAPC